MRNKITQIAKFFFLLFLSFPLSEGYSREEDQEKFQALFQSVVFIRNDSFLSESSAKPWMKESITIGYGTGVVIEGKKILTNAHVVRDSKYLTVQHFNRKKSYKARVLHSAVDCDLALITVEEDEFFEGVIPFAILEGYPLPGSELLVIGYPNGMDDLSVEKANVISIQKIRYSFSGLDIRNAIKISSKIVPGNSGGPAVRRGKMAGLVFQISQVEENIAYLIPSEIIQHFLKDLEDGKYDGFPNLGFTFQSGENQSLKKFYKIPQDTQGILVNSVYPGSSFYDYIKPGDYIYKVDENLLNGEGELIGDKQIYLIDYIESKFVGDPVTIYFLRDGNKYKTTASLKLTESLNLYRDSNQDYFLSAGLVFQPISKIFFSRSEPEIPDSSTKYHFSYFIQDRLYRFKDRDIILGYVFSDPENIRYKDYRYKVVETINGYYPKDIRDFTELWHRFRQETIVIRFKRLPLPIVITPENRIRINTRIRKRFGVKDSENE